MLPEKRVNPKAKPFASLEKDAWLERLPVGQRHFVQGCIDSVVDFSQKLYAPYFRNCGLYAVGSSINQKKHEDVDLVLVGLDFRSVIEYDKVFLMDIGALIDEEIIVPSRHVVDPRLEVLAKVPGGPEVLGERSDMSELEKFMLRGMEYKGQLYEYNFDGSHVCVETHCSNSSDASSLVKDLRKHMIKYTSNAAYYIDDPFEPYFHPKANFLVSKFELLPIEKDISVDVLSLREFKFPCPYIDFIVHAENMHVPVWKKYQEKYMMPFVALHEWDLANSIVEDRPVLTNLDLPEFIDPSGHKRVKPHSYIVYLEEPPIIL